MSYFTLKHRKVVPAGDLLVWAKAYERSRRRIRGTKIGNYWISTIFLGINHQWSDDGPPLFFETMIFRHRPKHQRTLSAIDDQHRQFDTKNHLDDYQDRCSTHRQALKQHWQAVEHVKLIIKENSKNA